MYSISMSRPSVDPWVSAWQPDYQRQVSRAAAARSAVMQAVRERRSASRSVRPTPEPVRVESDQEPFVPADEQVPSGRLTTVG